MNFTTQLSGKVYDAFKPKLIAAKGACRNLIESVTADIEQLYNRRFTMKKLTNLMLPWLLLSACKAHACALSTNYWPIPSGYKEGAVDLNSIIKRQVSWDGSSGTNVNIAVPIDNVRTNINKIISHYKYINYLPDLVKDLQLTHFELMSYRVEPIVGNSFLNTDGSVEGTPGYLMPNVSIEAAENKWIIVLEYKLTFSWPNDKLHLNHKVEIITLTDGTLLYEYPGMGKCG